MMTSRACREQLELAAHELAKAADYERAARKLREGALLRIAGVAGEMKDVEAARACMPENFTSIPS